MIILHLADACRAFSDGYEEAGDDQAYLEAWGKAWEAYQASKAMCPPCEPGDPGDPPPPA